ncbi:phage tail protein [Nitratireductor aquimarinus]|uniref:phage tail protein n=1 Tax=Nitratireductor aquimarinus TaxID=889300 RepID=UPI0029353B9F|nr:phage tail protein [Nitratireductor aquimarinus]MDV2968720.1 phage tail protein [Nitratireductor aquimarinus]
MKPFVGAGGGSAPSNDPDSYFSDDTVEVILGISEGRIRGLKDGSAKNFYVGQTPLLNANGVPNFTDFELSVHKGSATGELIIPRLGGQSTSQSVNTELSQNVPVVRQGTQLDIDWIELRLVVNSLVSQTDEGARARGLDIMVEYKREDEDYWKPGVLYADKGLTFEETANAQRIIHRGDQASAVSAARQQVVYDQNSKPDPTTAERNLGNVYGHRVWWFDTANGSFSPRFYSNGEFFAPAEVLIYTSTPGRESASFEDPAYIGMLDPDREDLRRTIFFWSLGIPEGPRLGDLWYNPTSARLLWYNGTSWVATLAPEGVYDPTVGHNVVATDGVIRLHEKITSNAVKEVKIKVERAGVPYEVRVTKMTQDSHELKDDRTDISFESFQEIKAEPMLFPNLAVVHLMGRASDQFSSLPEFSGVYEGREVKVPSNYDPKTRTYDGIWDGTWKVAFTDNPAYIGYDLVDNDRYGMNSTYPIVLEPFDVYEAGMWCDLKRGDSDRPQFTFNQLIQEPQDARELAVYIFGTFGGRFFDDGNGYARLRIDNDSPAVHLFAKENVKEGVFKYSYTEAEGRKNDYTVSFKNPKLFYKEDRRRVFDQQRIETYGRVPDEFVAVGCNNAEEAIFRARVKLIADQTEVETVTFETAREGLYLEPYDIILVSDDDMDEVITGRIVGTDGHRTIYLRDNVYLEAGFDHEMVINLDDFSLAKLVIDASSVGKSTKVLTLAEDLPESGLPSQAVFSIGQDAKPYRVLTIGESEGSADGKSDGENIIITAIEVNRTKYAEAAEDDQVIQIETPVFEDDLSAVTNARITPRTETRQGRVVQNLLVQWDQHPNRFARTYAIASRFNDDPWVYHGQVRDPRFELPDTLQGRYIFSIQAISLTGQKSVVAYVDIDLSGEVRAVAPVENIVLLDENGTAGEVHLYDETEMRLQWNQGEPNPALSSFSIRVFNDVEQEIFTSFVGLPEFTFTTQQMRVAGATRQLRVEIVAVDLYGNESEPRSIVVRNPAPPAPLVSAANGFGSIEVFWDIDDLPDRAGTLVWVSDEPGINPAGTAPTYDTQESRLLIPTPTGETRYALVAVYDTMGKFELNYSAEVNARAYAAVDVDPPEKPTGLTLASHIETVAGVVQRQVLVATVDDSPSDDFAYFDWEIKQNAGNFVAFSSSSSTKEWNVLPEQEYRVRVRAVDKMGNASDYTDVELHTTPECPDLAHLINAGDTRIEPGKIHISGATTLADWRRGGDDTRIDGNQLSTGTVSAEKAVFGQRGLTIEGLQFEHNTPSLNTVSWSGGTVRYVGDDGNFVTRTISAGSATWSAGTLYIYFAKGTTSLASTTSIATAMDENHVVFAAYRGNTDLVTEYGRTIIDGSQIKTGTIKAQQIDVNAIKAQHIDAEAIQAHHIKANSVKAAQIDVDNLAAVSANMGLIKAGRMESPDGKVVFDLNNKFLSMEV